MNPRTLLPIALLVGLTACGGVDPDSPLGKRQAIFKQMLKTSEDLGGMLRGRLKFDAPRFVAGAAELEQLSRAPWQHFSRVKEEADTQAKDEVWERQAQFQQLARDLESATAALVLATQARPLEGAALEAPVRRVEDSCKACHEAFRVY
ncbi:MAG: cytochrome c [Pseudomonadota bacterium]